MKTLIRLIGNLIGLLSSLLAVAGASDQIATWSRWLATIHTYLGNPFAYLALTLFTSFVFALTWAEFIVERRITKSGGITRREFAARLAGWDRVSSFTVSQVAWLWVGLEPLEADTGGTAAHAALVRVSQDIAVGQLKPGETATDLKSAKLDRQQLVDYAIHVGEHPSFLFPHERGLAGIWLRICGRIAGTTVTLYEVRNQYLTKLSEWETGVGLWAVQNHMGYLDALKRARAELHQNLRAGVVQAIGKRERSGVVFDYEKIPKRSWKRLSFKNFSQTVSGERGESFVDLRLKFSDTKTVR